MHDWYFGRPIRDEWVCRRCNASTWSQTKPSPDRRVTVWEDGFGFREYTCDQLMVWSIMVG